MARLSTFPVVASLLYWGLGTGCATAEGPRVDVVPDGSQVEWRAGRGLVTQQQDAVRVMASFDFATPDLLAFKVAVTNLGEAPLVVDPQRVYFSRCAAKRKCPTAAPVHGPDLILADLDRQRMRSETDAHDARLGADILIILAAAIEVTSLATGQVRHEPLLASSSLVNATAGLHEDVAGQRLSDEQTRWRTSALRLMTLAPQERSDGYVFVPFDPQAKFVWLDVLAGGRWFSFRFEQFVTEPATTAPRRIRLPSDPPE